MPDPVFEQPFTGIARFLRHLWATDGCLWFKDGRAAIYYATSSERLARDVQSLLLRIGVVAGLDPRASSRMPGGTSSTSRVSGARGLSGASSPWSVRSVIAPERGRRRPRSAISAA